MLRYEYQQKLLVRHSHGNVQKDSSYFKEMPEVPNDIIVVNEQPKVVMKQLEQQSHEMRDTNTIIIASRQAIQMELSLRPNHSPRLYLHLLQL